MQHPKMGFATSPFTLEPVRSNEFKQAQISKEIYSLTSHIEKIKSSICKIQIQKSQREAEEAKMLAKGAYSAPATASVEADADAGGDTFGGESGNKAEISRTSHFYRTSGLPDRFERPDKWKYSVKKQHPSYTTTTNTYGSKVPTVHEMPTIFKGQSSKFSVSLDRAGPYRNFSLNI